MPYLELTLRTPDEPTQELLIAELDALGFESFVQETAQELKAYVAQSDYDPATLQPILKQYGAQLTAHVELQDENWNAQWEANYDSVGIDRFLLIYPEHKPPTEAQRVQYPLRLCVQPQMSFGTGHHVTTRLMVRMMQGLDLRGHRVLDMGCGTGVLGMLAMLLGAEHVDFVDIDAAAVANTAENLARNSLSDRSHAIWQGDSNSLPKQPGYDVILANIQRNVLLNDAEAYAGRLGIGGRLLMSGFFDLDGPTLLAKFITLKMVPVRTLQEQDWQSLHLEKLGRKPDPSA